MRILVTGGAGFIGSHVVDAYLEAGHDVVVVDDLSTGRKENLNPRAKFYRKNILDSDLGPLLKEEHIAAVNHHAAQILVSKSMEAPAFDAKVNVLGMVNLLEACRKTGIRKFIFASSGGAQYGEAGEDPLTEEAPQRPVSIYGASKVAGELYLGVFTRQYPMTSVILRYSNVYGPRQDPNGEGGVVAIFTHGMLNATDFKIHGDGENIRDYVYVKDVARSNLLALSYDKSDAFNIGTSVGTSVNELHVSLVRITGYPRPPRYGPARPGDLRRSVLNVEKANRMLKWEPQFDLDHGLRQTVEYYKEKR